MRNFLKTLCGAFTVASAFLLPAEAVAQNQLSVGYVSPEESVYPYTGFTNSSQEGGTLYFVVRMDASKFSNYAGASLSGIRIGWSMGAEALTPDMEVFVRESLDGENLASGTSQVQFGWNSIQFDTPYTISGDKDLYLGGKVDWAPGSWLATGTYGVKLPENTQFMGNSLDVDGDGNLNWIDASAKDAILLLGLVEASGEEFNDKGSLQVVRSNVFQSIENPGNALLVIKNDGFNEMQSVEICESFGNETWTYPMDFSRPIGAGDQVNVTGGVKAFGTGLHELWISKVNGVEVKNIVKQSVNLIAIPGDVSKKYTRRPLVERWVSESNHQSPVYTDDIFLPGVDPYREKMSLVSHHVSDQFMVYHESADKDIDSEDVKFLVDFGNGDKGRVYIPSFAVDRSYIPESPMARSTDVSVAYWFLYPDPAAVLYQAALKVPTFASVEALCATSGDKCDIEVSGNIEPGIMPEGENLQLTVYLVEDGVESTSQEFPDDAEVIDRYKGVYTHKDLIRASLTEMYGDVVEGSGEYTRKYECEIDPEWNLENMRVLAFLNRSDKYGEMQVINSCESKMDYSGVESIMAPESQFSIEGRDIVAAPGNVTEVYTIGGARVAGKNLCPGIYIVKTAGTEGISARKIVIK